MNANIRAMLDASLEQHIARFDGLTFAQWKGQPCIVYRFRVSRLAGSRHSRAEINRMKRFARDVWIRRKLSYSILFTQPDVELTTGPWFAVSTEPTMFVAAVPR